MSDVTPGALYEAIDAEFRDDGIPWAKQRRSMRQTYQNYAKIINAWNARRVARGIGAEGQDAQRLGAEPAEPGAACGTRPEAHAASQGEREAMAAEVKRLATRAMLAAYDNTGSEPSCSAAARAHDDLHAAIDRLAAVTPPTVPEGLTLTERQRRRLFEFVEETRGYLNCDAMSPSLYNEAADMMQLLRSAAASPPPPTAADAAAVNVLRELVAIEDLKKSLAEAGHHAARFPSDENYAVIDSLSTEIAKRRPAAWAAARGIEADARRAGAKSPVPTGTRPDDVRELSKWLSEDPNRPVDRQALARVLERAEAAEREAQRYRWLRDVAVGFGHDDGRPSPWAVSGTRAEDSAPCRGTELDAAIDAAAKEGTS